MNTNEKCYKRIEIVLYLSTILLLLIAFILSYTLCNHIEPEDNGVVINESNNSEDQLSDAIVNNENKPSPDIPIPNPVLNSYEHSTEPFKNSRNTQFSQEHKNTQPNESNNSGHDGSINDTQLCENNNDQKSHDYNNILPYEQKSNVYDMIGNNKPCEDNNARLCEDNNTVYDVFSNIQPCEGDNSVYTEVRNIQPCNDIKIKSNEDKVTVYNGDSNLKPCEDNNGQKNNESNNILPIEDKSSVYDEDSNIRANGDNNIKTNEDNVTVYDEYSNRHPRENINNVYVDNNIQQGSENNNEYSKENNNVIFEGDKNIQLCEANNAQKLRENNKTFRSESCTNKVHEHITNISPFQDNRYTNIHADNSTDQHSNEELNTKANKVNSDTQISDFEENISHIKHTEESNFENSNNISNKEQRDSCCNKSSIGFEDNYQSNINIPETKNQSISHEEQINDRQLKIIRQLKRNNFKSIHIRNKNKLKFEKRIKFKNKRKSKTLKRLTEFKKAQERSIRSRSNKNADSFDNNNSIIATMPHEEKIEPLSSSHSSSIENTNILQVGNVIKMDSQLNEHKQNSKSKEHLSTISEQSNSLRLSPEIKFHEEREWVQTFHKKRAEYNEARDKWESKLCDLLNDFHTKFFKKQHDKFYQISGFRFELPFNTGMFRGKMLISFFEEKLKEIYEIFKNNKISRLKNQSNISYNSDLIILADLMIHMRFSHHYCRTSYCVEILNIIKIIILERELNVILINHTTELIAIYNKFIFVFKDIFKAVPTKFQYTRGFYNDLVVELRCLKAYRDTLEKCMDLLETMYNGW